MFAWKSDGQRLSLSDEGATTVSSGEAFFCDNALLSVFALASSQMEDVRV